MDDDKFNMSMRKFLKQVGVTSQQRIEEAVRKSGKKTGVIKVRAVVTAARYRPRPRHRRRDRAQLTGCGLARLMGMANELITLPR